MKTFSLAAALILAAAAACGGVVVNPIASDSSPTSPGSETDGSASNTPMPKAPTAPYEPTVGTTDVSILYPMPLAGESKAFVRASAAGEYGPLLERETFTTVAGTNLDVVRSDPPSGYDNLALISFRLDPCSARGGTGCTSEVRLVFQAVYERTAGFVDVGDDRTLGMAATDGALHVIYNISEGELVIMMKQILTLKAANGGLADQVLGVHPILATQGLGGSFANGLRSILLEHLGEARIGRVTTFDHNFGADSDAWQFRTFDKFDGSLTQTVIPTTAEKNLQMIGSPAFSEPIASSFAFRATAVPFEVEALLDNRPAVGSPDVATRLVPAFLAAVRAQNPNVHNAQTIDCATCHFAEGARIIGESVYGLASAQTFTHPRGLDYKSERTSVTNLHAFGYLHRQISVMQRTANESVIVAEAMQQKVQ